MPRSMETPKLESLLTVVSGAELQMQALSPAYVCASRKRSDGSKKVQMESG